MAWPRTCELGTPRLVPPASWPGAPLRRRQPGRCRRVHECEVPGHDVRAGQQVLSPGLAGRRPGVCGRGSLRRGHGLLPAAPNLEEVRNGGGDQRGVQEQFVGRKAGGRVHAGALGLWPGGRLPGPRRGARVPVTGRVANGRQWGTSWRCRLVAGRQRCSGSSPAAGRWQPHRRPVFGCGQRPDALAKQVTQAVAAAGGLRDQMLVMRSLQVAAGGGQAGARQRRGGVGVDIGARLQAPLAKQPPRPSRQVL
jgi:hypothetical protein